MSMNYYVNKEEEKSPFLKGQMPVVLTPAWEAQKLPNDELNFKGVKMSKSFALEDTQVPPKDKYNLVYLTFTLHGLGTLITWNMFITAKSYFVDFKLASKDTNTTTSYDSYFLQYLGFASQIPNLLFSWLNIFVPLSGDLTKRIVYSIIVELIIFIITVILAMVDSNSWADIFFWITMISVVLLNMASGVYQNTIYGIVATLPIKYTGSVVLGSNISGLFTSLVEICSSYYFTSYRTSAIYYFITAILVLLICFDTYFALPLSRFYRYYESLRNQSDRKKTVVVAEEDGKVAYWTVFKMAAPQLFNVFLIFFVTLALFPAVHSDIKPSSEDFFIREDLYTSITCFLTFNLFAMLGSLTTSCIQWPKAKYLWLPVVGRLLFLPLFVFCNYLPKDVQRTTPVLISNDWIYWLIGSLMSYSSGYLSSLAMMYAPQMVPVKYQTLAGMFAAAMLITGIFSGILFSFVFPYFVLF